eukprot:2827433-Pleurochrysis_carterae.AAC.1
MVLGVLTPLCQPVACVLWEDASCPMPRAFTHNALHEVMLQARRARVTSPHARLASARRAMSRTRSMLSSSPLCCTSALALLASVQASVAADLKAAEACALPHLCTSPGLGCVHSVVIKYSLHLSFLGRGRNSTNWGAGAFCAIDDAASTCQPMPQVSR